MRPFQVTLRIGLTALIAGCTVGDDPTNSEPAGPAPVASVEVTPTEVSLFVGEVSQLAVTARDASGNVLTGRAATWSSSRSSLATVSQSGLVQAVAPGTAQVTAIVEGRAGSAEVTIRAPSTLTGKVTQVGSTAGLSGAVVSVQGKNATTTADGIYRITDLTPGVAEVRASASGFSDLSHTVDLVEGQNTFNIQMTSTVVNSVLSGTVRNSRGEGVSGAIVSVAGFNSSTDAIGRFFFPAIPQGTRTIRVSADAYRGADLDVLLFQASLDINISLEAQPIDLGGLELVDDSWDGEIVLRWASDLPTTLESVEILLARNARDANRLATNRTVLGNSQVTLTVDQWGVYLVGARAVDIDGGRGPISTVEAQVAQTVFSVDFSTRSYTLDEVDLGSRPFQADGFLEFDPAGFRDQWARLNFPSFPAGQRPYWELVVEWYRQSGPSGYCEVRVETPTVSYSRVGNSGVVLGSNSLSGWTYAGNGSDFWNQFYEIRASTNSFPGSTSTLARTSARGMFEPGANEDLYTTKLIVGGEVVSSRSVSVPQVRQNPPAFSSDTRALRFREVAQAGCHFRSATYRIVDPAWAN